MSIDDLKFIAKRLIKGWYKKKLEEKLKSQLKGIFL
jgi:hypothetical protein